MRKQESLEQIFIKKVASILKEKGITGEKLAYESDISKGYISMLLRGKVSPTLKMVEKIAKNLEMDPKDLL